MKSRWSDAEAAKFTGPLGPRVYTSRLLGAEKSLVLHGGGNTSVKLREKDIFGEEREVLYVKGSGWDLATIEAEGFVPLPLAYMQKLPSLPALSDAQMVNELNTHVLRAGARVHVRPVRGDEHQVVARGPPRGVERVAGDVVDPRVEARPEAERGAPVVHAGVTDHRGELAVVGHRD